MKRPTVSIDDIAPEIRLTKHQRRMLIVIGHDLEVGLPLAMRYGASVRALERLGYIAWTPKTRFELTELGAMRYRAELSHRAHCEGCRACEGMR